VFRTLFLAAEDGVPDTLRPRLAALGADCRAIFACDEPLSLAGAAGLASLAQMVEAYGPRLVVIDPLVAFLGGATDMYRANEVRSVLAPLVRLAEVHRCAILAVRHLNKAKLGRAIYSGQGSIDFTAAARSVLLAGSSAEDGERHALIHIKSNLAACGAAVGYRLVPAFCWEGASALTADDLLAPAAAADEISAEDEAQSFLCSVLAGGEPLPARLVFAMARDAGVAARTLKRAKRKAGVRTVRRGFGAGSTWLWSLAGAGAGADGEACEEACEEGRTKVWPPSGTVGPLGGIEARTGGSGADGRAEHSSAHRDKDLLL
jgi:hypothetical protein